MKVCLPIDLNTPVAIECGTVNKLPIIKTSPYYDAWISCHMDVMLKDESLEVRCGAADIPISYGYHDDIINAEEINFWELNPNNIIDRLTSEINKGYYIIICVLKEDYRKNYYMHSHVLYGFDTTEQYFNTVVPGLTNCVAEKLSFEYIITSFKQTYNFFKKNTDFFVYGRDHSFVITRISLKQNINIDAYIHRALLKLSNEYDGKCCDITEYDDKKAEVHTRKCFRGLGCLLRIEKAFVETKEAGTLDVLPMYFVKTAIARLREHRTINLSSMNWIYSRLNIYDKKIIEYISDYENCRKNFDLIVNLLIKLEVDKPNQMNVLEKIIINLKDQYYNERQALSKFIDRTYELLHVYYSFDYYNSLQNNDKNNFDESTNAV